MKKLLIFHRTIAPYRIDFFNDLSSRFDTRICLYYKNLLSQIFDYSKIESDLKVSPVYLKKCFSVKGRAVYMGLWKEISLFEPDIVLVDEYGYSAIAVLLYKFSHSKKFKVVSICDDSFDMLVNANDFSAVHRLMRKAIVPSLNDVILPNNQSRDWYQARFSKGFYYPIISKDSRIRDNFRKAIPLSQSLIEKWNLSGKNVFLFVGRLVKIKNIDAIIKAFAQLDQQQNVLCIIGEGPEQEGGKKIIESLHCNAIMTGRLEGMDLFAWYNIGKCLILASTREAFGTVVNEALLAGCYCLVSEKAGSTCLIVERVNGMTFDPYNIDDLSRKMDEVSKWVNNDKDKDGLRHNQMKINYNDMMDSLVSHLNLL